MALYALDIYATSAKEGGRVGWGCPRTKSGGGALGRKRRRTECGSGQGGVGRCA